MSFCMAVPNGYFLILLLYNIYAYGLSCESPVIYLTIPFFPFTLVSCLFTSALVSCLFTSALWNFNFLNTNLCEIWSHLFVLGSQILLIYKPAMWTWKLLPVFCSVHRTQMIAVAIICFPDMFSSLEGDLNFMVEWRLNNLVFLDFRLIDMIACWRPAPLPSWASTPSSQTRMPLLLKHWSILHWPSTTNWKSG